MNIAGLIHCYKKYFSFLSVNILPKYIKNITDAYKVEAYNPRAAASLAVHLVSQVLDEAYIIANAIKTTGL